MATTATILGRSRTRRASAFEDLLLRTSSIRNLSSGIKLELNLSALLNGVWQQRKILASKEYLYFCLVGDDLVRDQIPLHEIDGLELMNASQDLSSLRTEECEHSRSPTRRSDRHEKLSEPHVSISSKIFRLRTAAGGFNSGRTYYLQAEIDKDYMIIRNEMMTLISAAKKKAQENSNFRQSRKAVVNMVNSVVFQSISNILIVANFAMSILEAQIQNEAGGTISFDAIDSFLIVAFSLELVLNAYGFWFKEFFQNPWCVFDLIVVSLSLIALAPIGLSPRVVLLLRCVRVLRIFGKVESVKKIFTALFRSILPMANAFFIIFVVSSIYAIIGVTFYSDDAPDSFDTFCRAFISMFCIIVGYVDWWFEQFPSVLEDGTINFGPSAFLISFVILVNWMFFQVSIAVLLDNFLAASNSMKEEEILLAIQQKQSETRFHNPLDPLLLRLSKDFSTDSDLTARLVELFQMLDSDGSGDLSSQEFQAAMRKLDFNPRIFVSDSDFVAITKNGALCNSKGHIGIKEFEVMMREQLRLYVQSRMSTASVYWRTSDQDFTELGTLKQILLEQLSIKADQERILRFLDQIASDRQGSPTSALPPASHESSLPFPAGASRRTTSKSTAPTIEGAPHRRVADVVGEGGAEGVAAHASSERSVDENPESLVTSLRSSLRSHGRSGSARATSGRSLDSIFPSNWEASLAQVAQAKASDEEEGLERRLQARNLKVSGDSSRAEVTQLLDALRAVPAALEISSPTPSCNLAVEIEIHENTQKPQNGLDCNSYKLQHLTCMGSADGETAKQDAYLLSQSSASEAFAVARGGPSRKASIPLANLLPSLPVESQFLREQVSSCRPSPRPSANDGGDDGSCTDRKITNGKLATYHSDDEGAWYRRSALVDIRDVAMGRASQSFRTSINETRSAGTKAGRLRVKDRQQSSGTA